MSELWAKAKQNPWVVGIACGWVILAFIFAMQRHGWSIFNPAVLWDKLGNIVLLRWLNSTLVTGLLAIIAALIGAYSLHKNSLLQLKQQKLDALRLCAIHAGTILNEIDQNKKPNSTYVQGFIDSASRVSLVDVDAAWLAICTSKHLVTYLENSTVDNHQKNHAFTMLAALKMLMRDIHSRIEQDRFIKLEPKDSIFEEIKSHINNPENRIQSRNLGEYGRFMNQSTSTPPAADAAPDPK